MNKVVPIRGFRPVEPTVAIQVRVPKALHDAFRILCIEQGQTMQQVLERLIGHYTSLPRPWIPTG